MVWLMKPKFVFNYRLYSNPAFQENFNDFYKMKELVESDDEANYKLVMELLKSYSLPFLDSYEKKDFKTQKFLLRYLFSCKSIRYAELDLSNLKLRYFPAKSLKDCAYSLNLDKNNLKRIDRLEKFGFGWQLRDLSIAHNKLKYIDNHIGKLWLNKLNLSHNRLTQTPKIATYLRFLNLSFNSITDISSLQKHAHFEMLNLSHNAIVDITDFITIPQAKHLNLQNNQIEDCSELQNVRIEKLNLSKNKISMPFRNVKHADVLTFLNLQDNQISEIPEDFKDFINLRYLNISCNQLKLLPVTISNLKNLKTLILQKNQISAIQCSFAQMALEYLDLSYNQLVHLPELNKKSLIHLKLNNNQFETLPESVTDESCQLKKLYLQNNQLTNIPENIENLKKLRELNCYNNSIQELPASFTNLKKLVKLSLRKNKFKALPPVLKKLKHLQWLDLGENHFQNSDIKNLQKELPLCKIIV